MNKFKTAAVLALLTVFLMPLAAVSSAAEEETFSALLYWVDAGPATGKTTMIYMTVERWTTDEERMELYNILKEKGTEELKKAMRKTTVGYIRSTSTLRYPLNIASSFQTEKGRLIRLVTERPIQWIELTGGTSPRTREYDFGVVEFLLDENGKGEGSLIPTAKVMLNDEGKIVVETLGTGPQKLRNVKKTK